MLDLNSFSYPWIFNALSFQQDFFFLNIMDGYVSRPRMKNRENQYFAYLYDEGYLSLFLYAVSSILTKRK